MQGSVEWPQLLAIVGMLSICGSTVAGVVAWLWGKMAANDREHRATTDALKNGLHTLHVEIAEKYVPNSELSKVEARIERTLGSMSEKVEHGFNRLTDMINKIMTNDHHNPR